METLQNLREPFHDVSGLVCRSYRSKREVNLGRKVPKRTGHIQCSNDSTISYPSQVLHIWTLKAVTLVETLAG